MLKILLFLTLAAFASALPPPEEAARLLGSERKAERDALTLELWEAGRPALPLLAVLADSDDPEIAHRAGFIFRRLKMGLRPDSPDDLLVLAADLEKASAELREEALVKLIDHPLGVPVALAFLDLWSLEVPRSDDRFQRWTHAVTIALLEQRNYWKTFFNEALTPRCRGALVADLGSQSMPMKHLMIERLATPDTHEVFEEARRHSSELAPLVYESLAKAALLTGDSGTALDILFEALPGAEDSRPLRQIAFLEKLTGLPARRYQGPRQMELDLLRARAAGDLEKTRELASRLPADSLLAYESRLLSGELPLPSPDLPVDELSQILTKAISQSFASPPQEPDIEDLASTVTQEAGRLSKTLLLLGHPVEAAQILADRHHNDAAVRILWMTGNRVQATRIAESLMAGGDSKAQISMRLTLSHLLAWSLDRDAARHIFEPLFQEKIDFEHLRRDAVHIASRLYPREKVLKLVPEMERENPYNRRMAISSLLIYPQEVAIFCYEECVKDHPSLKPLQFLEKVEDHLSKTRVFLLDHYQEILRELEGKVVQPSSPEFQLVLFLKAPCAIKMVACSAWHRLSTSDLETLVADESWPLEERKRALEIALEIAPASPLLRQFDLDLNQSGSAELVALLTLGDASEISRLASGNSYDSLRLLVAELADLNEAASIRGLHQTAGSQLTDNHPELASRFLQAAFVGEMVLGTQPETPPARFAHSLQTYLRARRELAATPELRELWTVREKRWESGKTR